MLDGFNSYFEILLTLNLAYAGSKMIKEIIDAFFNEPLFKKLDLLEKVQLEGVDEKIEEKKKQLIRDYNDFRETPLTVSSKSMFILSSLYCLVILLISGLEAELSLNEHHVQKFCSFLNIILLYQTFLYYYARKGESPSWIKNLIATSLFIFIFVIIFAILYSLLVPYNIECPKIILFIPLIGIPLFALTLHILHASKKYRHFAKKIDELEVAKRVFEKD